MKANPWQIGDVLKNPKRSVVPIYQRTYAWKINPHLETFFDQVAAKAEERLNGNGHLPHYMGALLLIPRGTYSFGRMEVVDVVDGQQRLTTFQIFLAALRDLARSLGDNQIADVIGSLLLNAPSPQVHEQVDRYKLYPNAYDRKLYCDLIDLDWEGLRKKHPGSFYKNGKVLESAELPLRAWGFLRAEAEAFINDTRDPTDPIPVDKDSPATIVRRTNSPLGSFRGQRALVVSYLNTMAGPTTLDQIVGDLSPTYEPLVGDWAKTQGGGVRASILYHLKELQKLGQADLMNGDNLPEAASETKSPLDESTRAERLNALSVALLESFQVIVITLDEHDDAQVIFETLNAGGEPLAAMDLVRNDVFHRAARGGENVELLMENRWRAFEDRFWKEPGTRGRIKKPRIDFFLSDTLAAETGREILLTELYARYKSFVVERKFSSVDAELETLLRHAPTFRTLAAPMGDSSLAQIGRELAVFDVSTAYPLIFVIQASDAPEEEKAAFYHLIVSYVVRRMLCGLTAKNYNKVFLRLADELRKEGVSLTRGAEAFAALDGDTVRFPDDAEFRSAIASRRQYGNIQQHRLQYILARLEREARDKFDEDTSLPGNLTIEHVLPETWWEHWHLPDGTRAAADLMKGMNELQLKAIAEREALKHTLGNLTLLTGANNPSLGNLGFPAKKVRLKNSLLKLNHEIADMQDWTEQQIRDRASRLSDLGIGAWPSPTLSAHKQEPAT